MNKQKTWKEASTDNAKAMRDMLKKRDIVRQAARNEKRQRAMIGSDFD